MALEPIDIRDMAERYAKAWSSQSPEQESVPAEKPPPVAAGLIGILRHTSMSGLSSTLGSTISVARVPATSCVKT